MSSDPLEAATAAHAAGRLGEAERFALEAVRNEPTNLQAKLLLGVLAARTNRSEKAIKQFEEVLEADPQSFEALFWLSTLLRKAGALASSVDYGRKALEVRPNDPFALNNLGLSLQASGSLEESVEFFRQAARLKPGMGQIHHNVGISLSLLGRDADAAQAFRQALALAPNSLDSLLNLGQTLMNVNDFQGAVDISRRALRLNPTLAQAHLLLAGALTEQNKGREAETHIREAVAINSQDAAAQALLGGRLQSQGQIEEAGTCFQRSIEMQPVQGYGYYAMVHNRRLEEEDGPLLSRMEELAKNHTLTPKEQSFLEYALGKACEDLGEYEKAMEHYDAANAISYKLKFGERSFDREKYSAQVDWMMNALSKEAVEGTAGSQSTLPIFIVGQMRSGTTLVEQIVSAHPAVEAAGEQPFWTAHWREAFKDPAAPMGMLNQESVRALAERYLASLSAIAPGAQRVTDKMPANYAVLGLIHAALPNVKIIHTRRNPADTCISIYATPNRARIEFAHDKGNIVFGYRQYLRLMDHWRSVLPKTCLLEVDYESLVLDRENTTRTVIEFCGLEWSEACLSPERNVRAVTTPSVWQVRQPVYSSSIDRWRKFEPWLEEFRELL